MKERFLLRSASQTVNPAKKKSKEDESSKVVDLHRVLVALVASLLNSNCSNLRGYAIQMLECHRERWIAKLEKQLEEDLEALHFPKCILVSVSVKDSSTNRQ